MHTSVSGYGFYSRVRRWLHNGVSAPGRAVMLLAFLLLAGCNGGSSGGSASGDSPSGTPGTGTGTGTDNPGGGVLEEPKNVALSFEAVKGFRVTWTDAAAATHYQLHENPDGLSGFTPIGDPIAQGVETTLIDVPLFDRINAQYILSACNETTCIGSDLLSVSGTLEDSIGYVKAPNAGENDAFGHAVSLSSDGRLLAVGAPFAITLADNGIETPTPISSGAVFLFSRRAAGLWRHEGQLNGARDGDEFGTALSLSADGQQLIVGAPGDDDASTGINSEEVVFENQVDSGAAYVFARNTDGSWQRTAFVKAFNRGENDRFGTAVALSRDGTRFFVGAPGESADSNGVVTLSGINEAPADPDAAPGAGAVYTFVATEDGWAAEAFIKTFNSDADDHFGQSLAVSANGTTLIVGAPGEDGTGKGVNPQDNNATIDAGAAYVFALDTQWAQRAYLKASNSDLDYAFGRSVSVDAAGSVFAVGSPLESGRSQGIDGNQSRGSTLASGAVYLFSDDNTGTLQQAVYIKASDADGGECNRIANPPPGFRCKVGIGADLFGQSVLLSDDGLTLAVGAGTEGSLSTGINGDQREASRQEGGGPTGAVYLFSNENSLWAETAYLKAKNTGRNDGFGESAGGLGFSGDAQTLAVGAVRESGKTADFSDHGEDNSTRHAGAVYLY